MQNSKKYTIGVFLYSSPGTKTSILLSEFLFFNKLAEINPDVKFIFIPVTKHIAAKTNKYLNLLGPHVDYEILTIDHPLKTAQLRNAGFSGFFTYMLRNNFFGGAIDPRCKMAYILCSYVTNTLKLPLFIRTPDSEYNYQDYRMMINVRMNSPTSGQKFKRINKGQYPMIMAWERIDYSKVYWIANGSDKICDWAPDVLHNNVPKELKAEDIKESINRVLYVSDDILFGYTEYKDRLKLPNADKPHDGKICFAGYLKGSVAAKRPKRLKEIFGKNKYKIPTRIFGPGCNDIEAIKNKSNIELIENSFQGDEFFAFLSQQKAVIHFGKGNDNYSYVAKSICDCGIAGVPSLIYLPCDQNRIIFNDDRFYFSNEKELNVLNNKLKDERVREQYISDQREWIESTLSNKMYPNFKFSDHCNEGIYITSKLF